MKRVLVTGSSGLIGSEAAAFFDQRGWEVHGVDNNMRRDFFGPDGDTTWNLERLRGITKRFTHYPLDIRDRRGDGGPRRPPAPRPRHPLRRAALARPRQGPAVRRLRRQRRRRR